MSAISSFKDIESKRLDDKVLQISKRACNEDN